MRLKAKLTDGITNIKHDLNRYNEGLVRELSEYYVQKIVDNMEKKDTKMTGRLMESVELIHIDKFSKKTTVVVGSTLEYAPAVEEGQKPHMPPKDAIEEWVQRKINPEDLESVTLDVMSKIATEGTEPRYVFKKAATGSGGKQVARKIINEYENQMLFFFMKKFGSNL